MIGRMSLRLNGALLLPLSLLAPHAYAAEPVVHKIDNEAGDIIVTAQKRNERISDVAMSITALTGDALAARGVNDPNDLGGIVPGFTYTQSVGVGTPIYTLRGVGFAETSLAASPAVSIYVDEVPLPYAAMTRGASLDIARVEVLKGPQGTLFGQNSTGGAINYIAAVPGDTFEAGADFNYGRFNAVDMQGFVSGPLSSTLSARLSMRHEQADDWQKSYTRDDSLGRTNRDFARLLLHWRPSERLTFKFNVNGWTDDSDTQAGQLIQVTPQIPGLTPAALVGYPMAPFNNRSADWNPDRDYQRNDSFYHVSLRGDYELGQDLLLTSISAYQRYDPDATFDTDATAITNSDAVQTGKIASFYQEVRLQGSSSKLEWTLGANYGKDVVDDLIRYSAQMSTLAAAGLFRTSGTDHIEKVETKALFGDAAIGLGNGIKLRGGLRYNANDRNFSSCFRDGGDGILLNSILAISGAAAAPADGCLTLGATLQPGKVVDRLDQDNLSWRVGLDFKAHDDLLFYTNISKGYKSGSFPTIGAINAVQYRPATQESVLAYEAGVKAYWKAARLGFDAAMFHYSYNDKQFRGRTVDAIFGPLEALVNIPRSRVTGAEAQLRWSPVRALRLTGAVTWLDTRITRSFVNFDPFGNSVDLKGEAFPYTPRWMLAGTVDYERNISTDMRMFASISSTYQSDTTAAFGRKPQFTIPGYGLVDARLGLGKQGGGWEVALWGRNILNNKYWTNVGRLIDTAYRYSGSPATYGISMKVRFQ